MIRESARKGKMKKLKFLSILLDFEKRLTMRKKKWEWVLSHSIETFETWSAVNRARSGFDELLLSKHQMKPKLKWSHFFSVVSIATLQNEAKIKSELKMNDFDGNPNSFTFMFCTHLKRLQMKQIKSFMLIDAIFFVYFTCQLDNLNKCGECWWNLRRMNWNFFGSV